MVRNMNDPALELTTRRLALTLPTEEQAEEVRGYFVRNLDRFAPSSPPAPPELHAPGYWGRKLAAHRREYSEGRSVRLFLQLREAPARIVGHCSLTEITRGPLQACYLGYGLDGAAEGKGLMAEALGETIRFAFDELRLHRIQANHRPTNERSGALLRRLGFTVEGFARDYLFVGGGWQDHVLTSLTNPAPILPF